MKAIDTNLLVRFVVCDDAEQAERVFDLFKKCEENREQLFVPVMVCLELIWVLESVYSVPRKDVISVLSDLIFLPFLTFEQREALLELTVAGSGSKCDLSDLLIALSAKLNGCETVLTFDKKASQFSSFELV